jgi:dihydrofolate reductase
MWHWLKVIAAGQRRPDRWLFDNQLVDEITLFVCPVVVGQGTRLFPDSGPDVALELVESRSTPKG